MAATRAMVAIAKSMFGSGRDFRLTSARTASATASCPDFGAARRTRSWDLGPYKEDMGPYVGPDAACSLSL